jgi:hypothetical protein
MLVRFRAREARYSTRQSALPLRSNAGPCQEIYRRNGCRRPMRVALLAEVRAALLDRTRRMGPMKRAGRPCLQGVGFVRGRGLFVGKGTDCREAPASPPPVQGDREWQIHASDLVSERPVLLRQFPAPVSLTDLAPVEQVCTPAGLASGARDGRGRQLST